MARAIQTFTGKEDYQEGDIERAVVQKEREQQEEQLATTPTNNRDTLDPTKNAASVVRPQVNDQNSFSQQQTPPPPPPPQQQTRTTREPLKTLDIRIGPGFEDWDRAFRESHPGDLDLVVQESLTTATATMGDNNNGTTNRRIDSKYLLDLQIVNELDAWDRKFDNLYGSS